LHEVERPHDGATPLPRVAVTRFQEDTEPLSFATRAFSHTVGRVRERDELRAAFRGAQQGRGALLCVTGEPGIGKTTLVEEFLAELAAGGQATLARGRCSEWLSGTEAYLPLLEALESLLAADVEQVRLCKKIS
jgi:MoxR-like ATPase